MVKVADNDVARLVMALDPKDAKKQMDDWAKQGIKVSMKQGGTIGGKERAIVQGTGTASQIEQAYANLAKGTKAMKSVPGGGAQAPDLSWSQRIGNTFSRKNMHQMNKNLFMMQMASLGVAFSFQSIFGSAMGLAAGLQDLGGMIAGGAMGTAMGGLATGGEYTTNIAEVMGVSTEDMVAAWAGVTAIVSQFAAVVNGFMVKVLTPEMVAAILSVLDALAEQLARPEVVQAVQEIIIAVLQLGLQVIDLLPVIADLINWLGETGLLKTLLMIIFAAEVLLPTLAYLQFLFQAILLVGEIATVLGISLGTLFIWVGIILVAFDFLIHLFENLANGMDPLDAVLTAIGQTFADLMNVIIGALNPILGFFGMGKITPWSTASGTETAATTKATNVVNNFNFNKNVNTADKAAATRIASEMGNNSYG